MAEVRNQPETYNFLSNHGYRFILNRAPHAVYFGKSATLPGISLPGALHPTGLLELKRPGDQLSFDPLSIEFIVDENMTNYLEVWQWMIGLGFPENHSQYREVQNAETGSGLGLVSDATLSILSQHHNSSFDVTFKNLWPTALSEITFEQQTTDITYAVATATFEYDYYTFTSLID